jgi:DNA-binding beta-propeller fold protein YncE
MRVLRVDPATGKKGSYTELTRKNSIDYPGSLVYLAPFLYVTSPDTHQVFRIDPKTGAVHALGDGQRQTSDGAGGKASFCAPAGIATDGERLFVGEGFCGQFPGEWRGHAVRQVDLSEGKEQVTTLVGPGPEAHVVEGVGRRGGVNWPAALAYDSATRSLYVADRWDNVLLQID